MHTFLDTQVSLAPTPVRPSVCPSSVSDSFRFPSSQRPYNVGKLWISGSIWHRAIVIWSILQDVRIFMTPLHRFLNSSWHCVLCNFDRWSWSWRIRRTRWQQVICLTMCRACLFGTTAAWFPSVTKTPTNGRHMRCMIIERPLMRKNWKTWIASSMTIIFSIGKTPRCWSISQKVQKASKKHGRRLMDFLMRFLATMTQCVGESVHAT